VAAHSRVFSCWTFVGGNGGDDDVSDDDVGTGSVESDIRSEATLEPFPPPPRRLVNRSRVGTVVWRYAGEYEVESPEEASRGSLLSSSDPLTPLIWRRW